MFLTWPSTFVVPPELSTVCSKCAETVTYDFSSVVTKCGVCRVPCNMYNYMCVKVCSNSDISLQQCCDEVWSPSCAL